MTLTKARLSALVVVTTLFGYLLGSRGGNFDGWLLLHTLIGTTLCAFAAAAYNQIMEMEADAKMERTADRPLPSRRMSPEFAFVLGWILAAIGIVHLLMRVNLPAASLAAATIAVYIFIYTPLKTRSTTNTLVGAVSGALPPLIGWAAAGKALYTPEAVFLFGLLFFWQLPHFLAINWMYRDQYVKGGFVMWSNDDD
ncbi:MAG: protoheme IX farnesyltransferase, partial [Verrucomicrobiales bacterium]